MANAVTGTTGHEDVGVLGESIEQGGRQLVVAEDAVPLTEGEVGSDDRGGALVPGGEDVEEQLTTGLLEGHESGRDGARWPRFRGSVSPSRPPNRTCTLPRIRLSTSAPGS
jgi:hypothetical protein